MPKPLEPHSYPMHIKAFALIILGLFVYALMQTPEHYTAAKNYRLGEQKLTEGNYDEAIQYYVKVLATVPSSKRAKISIATAYFGNDDTTDDEIGLAYLWGISLSETEWEQLTKTMPEEYKTRFTTVKK